MATKSGRNIQEFCDIDIVINSHNFICTRWFYSYTENILSFKEELSFLIESVIDYYF